ncbi:hypothetical protein QBC34DRAFT_17578 [Podospora aff. communis PSN243]|uniref:Uncharacterized protein n=1 Tax=Podospora aff. communis PSN243 TaxID=3040156 RepID=A0AAV9GYR5_9PEZI|nr:hypothetical protein QBC34DRAFT_17578 [Podospora aff. communis PSN243]
MSHNTNGKPRLSSSPISLEDVGSRRRAKPPRHGTSVMDRDRGLVVMESRARKQPLAPKRTELIPSLWPKAQEVKNLHCGVAVLNLSGIQVMTVFGEAEARKKAASREPKLSFKPEQILQYRPKPRTVESYLSEARNLVLTIGGEVYRRSAMVGCCRLGREVRGCATEDGDADDGGEEEREKEEADHGDDDCNDAITIIPNRPEAMGWMRVVVPTRNLDVEDVGCAGEEVGGGSGTGPAI